MLPCLNIWGSEEIEHVHSMAMEMAMAPVTKDLFSESVLFFSVGSRLTPSRKAGRCS